ncbi:MAG: hypothetical protein H6832_05895 [Planctomycetes bacterium]|nr:hypothetical protein [Planctomycetota bacterium]MCB9917917.1 hypothetical protein [Planctomycetota bacterium]
MTPREPDPSTPRPILEICVDNIDDFERACGAGADRIELCSALVDEGLTPCEDLLEHAMTARASHGVDIVAMLRTRPGPFTCLEGDLDSIARDLARLQADRLHGHSVPSLVFGYLGSDHSIDEIAIDFVCSRCGDRELVFHRAFDQIPETSQSASIDFLVDRGFSRILTAGADGRAFEERALAFERLVRRARGRIEIVACGGLRASHVSKLIACGVRQFHASARPRDTNGRLDGPLDEKLVRDMRAALDETRRGTTESA